jgi:thioredoxin reductase
LFRSSSKWKWPTIAGLEDFKGTLLHSANYDLSVDLTGKRVAVIGSGSSGIQIVPAIRGHVKSVGAYLRSNTWIAPPFGAQYIKKDENGELILEYSEEEKKKFEEDPEAFMDYRRTLEKDVSHRCEYIFRAV